MKPEAILQSDLLDIIFENRNKAYGAYALRRNYNKRLLQALGGTVVLILTVVFLQGMKSKVTAASDSKVFEPKDLQVIDVAIQPLKPEPVEKDKAPKKPGATTALINPVIVPEDQPTTVATIDELEESIPAATTTTGAGVDRPVVTVTGDGLPKETIAEPVFDNTTVRHYADVMPEFPGDIVRYMLRHLRQPGDLEAGEKILIRVQFVVTPGGEVSSIEILQSGRKDLDEEVVRVIKKMPKWKPGMQGGRNVPVYFTLPVTFVSNG